MANFVTTNIRISEEDYLRLKEEAARKRTSLSAVIRDKIGSNPKTRSKVEVARIMAETRRIAKRNAKYLKGVDIVKTLREMRYNAKW